MPVDLSLVADTLTRELAARYRATVLSPADLSVKVARAILTGLGGLIPGAGPIIEGLLSRAEHTSITVPFPGGSLIVLAPQHVFDPLAHCEVVCHEMQHARYIEAEPDASVIVDYLGSGELRGLREAEAYAVGLWTLYLLTGELPTLDRAFGALASDAYHLDDGDQATARSTLESHLDTIRAGSVPPLAICRAILEVLQQHHPDAILAPEHGAPV